MKNYTLYTLLVTGVVLSANASLINFQSGTVSTYLQADGVTSLSASPEGNYVFALGTFDESFLSGNSDTWLSGFTDEMEATNVWKTTGAAPLQNKFQGSVSMSDGSATSSNAYIFGYKDDAEKSEIIIFRNAGWQFPAYAPVDLDGSDIISLLDANTQIIDSSGSWTNYSSNITMLFAVPEPSAFAAIAGLLTLGFVMVRRRRV